MNTNNKNRKLIYKNSAHGGAVVVKSSKQPKRKLSSSYNFSPKKEKKSNLNWSTTLGFVGSGFSIVITVLFIVVVFRTFLIPTSPIYSFESLMNVLTNSPRVVIPTKHIDLTISGDWGLFDFIRDFLNIFTNFFELILIGTDYVDFCIEYVSYFLQAFLNFVII